MLKFWKYAKGFLLLVLVSFATGCHNNSDEANAGNPSTLPRSKAETYFQQSKAALPRDAKLVCFPERYESDHNQELPLDDEYLVFTWSQQPSNGTLSKSAMYQSRNGMALGLAWSMNLSLDKREWQFTLPFYPLSGGGTTEQDNLSFNPDTGRFVEYYRNAMAPQFKIEIKSGNCRWIK